MKPAANGKGRKYVWCPPIPLLKAGKFKDTTDLAEKMIAAFPKDPNGPKLFYDMGIMLCDMAEKGAPAKSDPLWKNALVAFDRYCTLAPTSYQVGGAFVRRMNIALERMFDLPLAKTAADSGVIWAKDALRREHSAGGTTLEWTSAAAECLFNAAVVAYLSGDSSGAIHLLDLAGPVQPPAHMSEGTNTQKIGIHFLIRAIRANKSLTNDRALIAAKSEKEKLCVRLGDLYLESIRPEKAEQVLRRVATEDASLGPVTREVRAYALLQLAVALDRQTGKRTQALQSLQTLADTYTGTCWGGYGLFRLAVFTHNQTQDARKSLPLYAAMLAKYPDHPLSEKAYAYYCLSLLRAGQSREARESASAFATKFPTSRWLPVIQEKLADPKR